MADVTAKSKKDDIWNEYQKALKKIKELEGAAEAPVVEENNDLATKLAAYIEAVGKIETLQDRYDAQALWAEIEALAAEA